ncbi:hypothetical protein [Microterricola pindariensis]|uniref:Major facilitator superfamily (MFS) profile domain-containing protein n=1 Tax=Microterricola pindariensis TaxID=478010 RepID=A0ABX5AT46_9MICO|nr:hypothetical protein [Microterricola pindariensis]PPL14434.1 hypothetical protein GY24_16330 [Microterricola pindariensis]
MRQIIAVSLCWLPLLVLLLSLPATWEAVTGTITTQWQAAVASTQAPAWTALLLPASVSFLTGLLATAYDGGGRGRRIAYLFCFGSASAALWVWFCLLGANAGPAEPAMPNQILLFPFFVLLGFIPWAVAGRGAEAAGPDSPASQQIRSRSGAEPG